MSHTPSLTLHRFFLSGHCHRVECFASLLALPCTLVNVDLPNKAHKQADFLAMNPLGLVPVLEDGNQVVADSNAILVYLAKQYASGSSFDWLPEDAAQAAEVQRWLSISAGPLALGPAHARLKTVFGAPVDAELAIATAHALFAVMENHLAAADWLVGHAPTIADVAMYSYTAHAPEGNVSLAAYPAIRAWLARFEALPGFVPMHKTAVGLAA